MEGQKSMAIKIQLRQRRGRLSTDCDKITRQNERSLSGIRLDAQMLID